MPILAFVQWSPGAIDQGELGRRMIEANGLTKSYGDLVAVDDVSFSVEAGEIFGFLGPNGAGKTTTILMLLGILRPDAGSVTICGERVGPVHREVRRLVGAVSEKSFLYRDMSVLDYLRFFARLYRVPAGEERISTVLEELKLTGRRTDNAATLSKGLQQKLGLARALLHDPPVLILDEPVSGLDPHGLREVREIIVRERNRGRSVFLSSHVLSEVGRTADRVGIIRGGRLLAEATPGELLADLEGGRRLEIELEELAEGFVDAVAAVPGVARVETRGEILSIFVDSTRPREVRGALSRVLTEAGGTILGLREVEPSLEDVFVAITDPRLEETR